MKIKFSFFVGLTLVSSQLISQSEAPVIQSSAQYDAAYTTEFVSSTYPPQENIIVHDAFVKMIASAFDHEFMEKYETSIKSDQFVVANGSEYERVENNAGKFLYLKKEGQWQIDKFVIDQPNWSLSKIAVGSPSKKIYARLKLKQANKNFKRGQIWIVSDDGKVHLEFTLVNDKIIKMALCRD